MYRNLVVIFAIVLASVIDIGTSLAQPAEANTAPTLANKADASASPKKVTSKKKVGVEKASIPEKEHDKPKEPAYEFTDRRPVTYWMPSKASPLNDHVDWMFYAILGLSGFCFFAITFAVVYLSWRYRAREGYKPAPSPNHDNFLEITWTIIPSIICVFIFIGGWKGYLNMTSPPGNAMEINVTGKKWNWSFSYALGQDSITSGQLHVPANQAVKLVMRSDDVLHSLSIPSLRVKQDVVPGRYSYLWFEAQNPGVYRIYCTEYCGASHWNMKTKLVVHESGGYKKWLETAYKETQIDCRELPEDKRQECYMAEGQKLYVNNGCNGCHSTDGTVGTGPSFQGMWGQSRSFEDGTSGTVDENYVRESVLDPMAKVRKGFSPVMPTFKGKLKDKDIDALNNWMKTL